MPCRGGLFEHFFDFTANSLDDAQVRAGDLDADGGLDAGSQHIDASFNGPHPGIGDAGKG